MQVCVVIMVWWGHPSWEEGSYYQSKGSLGLAARQSPQLSAVFGLSLRHFWWMKIIEDSQESSLRVVRAGKPSCLTFRRSKAEHSCPDIGILCPLRWPTVSHLDCFPFGTKVALLPFASEDTSALSVYLESPKQQGIVERQYTGIDIPR